MGVGGWVGGWSDIFTMNPTLKYFFFLGGGGWLGLE